MSKYLDNNGLLYLWQKIKSYVTSKMPTKTSQLTNDSGYITSADVPAAITVDSALSSSSTNPVQNKVINTALGNKVDKVSGKGLSTNDYTTTEKNKLAGIATGANKYVLPKATPEVLGGVMVSAEISGSNAEGWKNTALDSDGHLYSAYPIDATTSKAGLMSTTDKTKLDGIAEGANNYTLPMASQYELGGVRIDMVNPDPIASGYDKAVMDDYGTLYSRLPQPATTDLDGLMTSSDKRKLDAFSAASNYALKTDITGLYKYKGSKATVSALPTSGNATGDVWNVEAGGMNYVWTGSAWDALGEVFTIDAITNSEIDTIVAS